MEAGKTQSKPPTTTYAMPNLATGLLMLTLVDAGQIGDDIYNIHIGQQTVASGSLSPSQNQRQRSQESGI